MSNTEWSRRWKFFSPAEVLSPLGLHLFETEEILLISETLLDKITSFRDRLGTPLWVNFGNHRLRGYRHFTEQQTIPNYEKFSQHVQGCAVDLTAPNLDVLELRNAALAFGFTGVGFYPKRNFVHVDIRQSFNNRVMQWVQD